MATKKSIAQNLPRFDYLRRTYRTFEQTGICPTCTFSSAFADLDEAGNVRGITVYAVGDGKDPRHYYAGEHDDVVNISDCIEDAISGQRIDECGYDAKKFRDMIITEIQSTIANAATAEE